MDRVPILALGDVLLVSIQVDLEDQLALALQEDLSERIVSSGAHGVIIDITALDIVDSFVGRMLATVAAVVEGARRGHRRCRNAAGCRHYARRAGAATARHPYGSQRRVGPPTVAPGAARGIRRIAGERPSRSRRRRARHRGPAVISASRRARHRCNRSSATMMWSASASSSGRPPSRQISALVDQTKAVTAASELARNTLKHGGGGRAEVQPVTNGRRQRLAGHVRRRRPGHPRCRSRVRRRVFHRRRPRSGIVRLPAADGRVRARHRRRGRHIGDRGQMGALIMLASFDWRIRAAEPRP